MSATTEKNKVNVGRPKGETKKQIALMAASGLDNRQIGEKLDLSPVTINQYLSEMYKVLDGVNSRTDLILYVINNDYDISDDTFI